MYSEFLHNNFDPYNLNYLKHHNMQLQAGQGDQVSGDGPTNPPVKNTQGENSAKVIYSTG